MAIHILENPRACLKKHKQYFEQIEGKKIANVCGSNGRKAVPLALLGAEVTVFDISEVNQKYALELAEYADTTINYIVTDIRRVSLDKSKKRHRCVKNVMRAQKTSLSCFKL
ncbi:MAG: hypothetical protein ACQEWF_23270 [Bacillota bacterium]